MVDRLDRLRKKVGFRGLRRGTRESDLLIGGFVAKFANSLDAEQVAMLDTLLEQNDQDLLSWVNEIRTPPPALRNVVLQMMIEYRKSL